MQKTKKLTVSGAPNLVSPTDTILIPVEYQFNLRAVCYELLCNISLLPTGPFWPCSDCISAYFPSWVKKSHNEIDQSSLPVSDLRGEDCLWAFVFMPSIYVPLWRGVNAQKQFYFQFCCLTFSLVIRAGNGEGGGRRSLLKFRAPSPWFLS